MHTDSQHGVRLTFILGAVGVVEGALPMLLVLLVLPIVPGSGLELVEALQRRVGTKLLSVCSDN